MPRQDRGSGGAGGDGHDEERLQQLMGRMRTALQPGWWTWNSYALRSSTKKSGENRWSNVDAQVQGQAVRAITAFVEVIPPRPFSLSHLQAHIEEAVAALEYLLAVEQDTIYRQAALASAGLGRATNGRYMLRLLSPLACLLAFSKAPEAAVSAATAMQSILATIRPQISSDGNMGDDPIWKVLQVSDALSHISWRLDKNHASLGIAECAEVLAMILERWPGARYRVGQVEAVRSSLRDHCMSSNEAVVVASLRACQASGVAVLHLQDGDSLWETLAHCLHQSRPLPVKREALRLLSLVGRLSSFSVSFKGPHTKSILEGCLWNLNQGNKSRLTVIEQGVVIEAAHTTSVLLRWAGDHHNEVLGLGIFKLVFLQLTLGEKRSATNAKIWVGSTEKLGVEWKSRGAGKVTSSLRSLLWEIVGYLAAHFNSKTTKEVLQGRGIVGPGLSGITVFACATLLRALHRSRDRTPVTTTSVSAYGTGAEQHISSQELLQICKTMFLLLTSASQDVSKPTIMAMETTMRLQDQTWLPGLVESLALGHTGPSQVKPESVQTATNLFALACFSYVPECRELLPQARTLEVLVAIVKIYGNRALERNQQESTSNTQWSVIHQRAGIAAKTCCEEITEYWEGADTILFASLCAFTNLMQGSDLARAVANSLPKGRLTEASFSEVFNGDIVSLLWKLAESTSVAAGVRWWAASGLACFNIYGFPSSLGPQICRIVDESLFPDIVFLFKDGRRLLAHGIILAVQCPSVLPKGLLRTEKKAVGDIVGHEIPLSAKISFRSFKDLLEFIYSGLVHLDLEEVDDMKKLARVIGLDSLTKLLHGKPPAWGLPPGSCNLASALESGGHPFADIILRGKTQGDAASEAIPCRLEKGCTETRTHAHGHRAILYSRSEYYQAVFSSGMRESTAEAIDINVPQQSLQTLLLFWYTGKLIRLTEATGWCAWNNLETDKKTLYLQNLVELAQFAGQRLMEDLQKDCNLLVLQHIEGCNLLLGPSVISHAATCEQKDLVDMWTKSIAPAYPHLRDNGALECLDESLRDLLRRAHIQSMRGSD